MSYQYEYKKRIKIGIIGAGSHCYRNILPVLNYLPVELKAICNPTEEKGRTIAKQYACNWYPNSQEMYNKEKDIEAVFIVVNPALHPSLVKEALSAGYHVWVEKPVAVRAFEVEEMIALRGDRVAIVGFKKAFMPATEKAKEIVSSPKYGSLKSILAVYYMSMPENGREELEQKKTPNWLLNGVHPLSFMCEIGKGK